jgi:hypothetical protein
MEFLQEKEGANELESLDVQTTLCEYDGKANVHRLAPVEGCWYDVWVHRFSLVLPIDLLATPGYPEAFSQIAHVPRMYSLADHCTVGMSYIV